MVAPSSCTVSIFLFCLFCAAIGFGRLRDEAEFAQSPTLRGTHDLCNHFVASIFVGAQLSLRLRGGGACCRASLRQTCVPLCLCHGFLIPANRAVSPHCAIDCPSALGPAPPSTPV